MKKLLLHGFLKKAACGSLMLKVGSIDDIIKCLQVNFPKLNSKLKKYNNLFDSIMIIIDGKIVSDKQCIRDLIRNCTVIELVPVQIFGFVSATFFITKLGVTSMVAAKALAFVTNVILVTALTFGISFLMTKLLAPKDPKQVKTSSYILSSKSNIAARNTAIPIGYGKLRVGSYIVSSLGMNFDYMSTNPLVPANTFLGAGSKNPTINTRLW